MGENFFQLFYKKKLVRNVTIFLLSILLVFLAFVVTKNFFQQGTDKTKTTTTLDNSFVDSDDPRNPNRTIQTLPAGIEEPGYVSAPPLPL